MSTATLDPAKEKLAKRVLKGRLTPLPKTPKGDKDKPEARLFIRSVQDLENPREVLDAICARVRQAADYRRIFEDEWRQAVRAWFQRTTEAREDAWESNRYLPIIFKHVETAIPSLVAATLDGNRIWKMDAMTRQGKNIALALERLCNWQAYTTAGAEEAYEDCYWWSAVIGTAFLDHYWDYREETRLQVIVREAKDPNGNPRKVKEVVEQQGVVVADTPKIVCLNPLDVFPSPEAGPGDDLPWVVERVRTTIGALRDAVGEPGSASGGHLDGVSLETWIEEENPGKEAGEDDWFDELVSDTWDDWMREMGYEGRDDTRDSDDVLTNERVVTVLRYRSKTEIITLGSPRHILGYSRNPYVHGKTGMVIHHFFKVPGSPYGRGIGTLLLGHQSLANENINRWMDTAAVEAAAPIIAQRNAVSILDDEFVFEPNKVIRALDVNAVKRMEVPAPTALAMQLDAHLQGDADDVTGFSEQARGVAPSSSQTATAFSGLQSNLRTRLILHVRRAARTIRVSGDLLVALNQQFMTEEQIVSVVGEDAVEYVQIQPWEIVGKVVVKATLNASRAQPELRAQRLMALTQVALPLLAQGAASNPSVARWLRMLLDENEIENADLIIPKIPTTNLDPLMENEALKRGVKLDPLPTDDHMGHIQAHGALHEEALAAGLVGVAGVVVEHIQKHLLVASQQAMAMGGGGPPGAGAQQPGGPETGGGNTPGEQEGGATDGAAARNGAPGVASPGPAAPPGRPPPR